MAVAGDAHEKGMKDMGFLWGEVYELGKFDLPYGQLHELVDIASAFLDREARVLEGTDIAESAPLCDLQIACKFVSGVVDVTA